MYFREINKRCTICLVLWHYLGLKNSRNTVRHWDDFERKIREIPLASVARKIREIPFVTIMLIKIRLVLPR